MAAYAALVNLLNILDQIQDHPRLSPTLQQEQIEALKEKVHFLLDFLESGPLHRGCEEEAQVLENQITSAAYAAEDVIETHVVDQIKAAGSVSLLDLQTVIQDMDYVKKKVVTFKHQIKDLKPKYYRSSASTCSETPHSTTGKGTMVGFDNELYQLMDALTGYETNLQIIPIVGMGGIGKTTLAINVYENPLILERFDTRAWATISQEYSIKDIFSNLLSRESKSSSETEYQQLAQDLYQTLIGRRYLIVLDDMWSIGVWDKIKFFFPDNNNGSRVIVTTRLSDMATHFSTSLLPLKLLDEDNSWKLFCKKAFPQEGCCPSHLEVFGKKIVEKCGGLPLLIVVIGALLRKSLRTRECWEDIWHDIISVLNTEEEEMKSLDILYLSYRHLPAHLKPCFLYMGMFPEDDEIRPSRLIKLWISEGFVKSNKTQSLEEVARGYLKDVIDRNLLVLRTNEYGERKTCQMHDLLRDLCIKIGEKENFIHVIRADDIRQQGAVHKGRRIVFQQGTSSELTIDGLESASPLTRSLVSDGNLRLTKFKLLRVLNTSSSFYFMDDILKHVNLRYFCINRQIPGYRLSSISLLWNLQTLIIGEVGEEFVAPPQIWEMRQLRHVNINEIRLPDPPLSNYQRADDVVALRNLQSLKTAWDLRLSEEVCKRIPHVKKLGVFYYRLLGSSSYDFGRLHELEFLKCGLWRKPNRDDLLQNLTFPSSLQKLILRGCHLHWEDLSMIGSLPHLQVLQLQTNSVTGPEWDPVEGEFLCLKSLTISWCGDLINWNADKSSFPVLEKLVVVGLENLKEIPSGIGEIPTLGFVESNRCSESVAISAVEILDEQQSLGNGGLQVLIRFWREVEIRSFKKKVQHMECFTSTNLKVRDQF